MQGTRGGPDHKAAQPQALGYTARDVVAALGVPPSRIRAWVDSGFVRPARGLRGEYVFSFRDLLLMKTAHGRAGKMSGRRMRRALQNLRQQLPQGRPLSAVSLTPAGKAVLARDGSSQWLVDSGQSVFDFEAKVLERSAGTSSQLPSAETADAGPGDADAWFQLGCDLEGSKPAQAREAYRRALAIDSSHPDAHINLGRLVHESGELAEAENHYRRALNSRPNDVTAAFNLGVVLDDQGKLHQAVIAYRQAIACDPTCADAHFNLAQLYERVGRRADAIRHLKACRGLTTTS